MAFSGRAKGIVDHDGAFDSPIPKRSSREMRGQMKKVRTTLVSVVFAAAIVVAGLSAACGDDDTSRQAQVAARGATVMPFDLKKTHHTFEQTVPGGIESVRTLDPADSQQIALVRSHLEMEAKNFSAGNFADPMAIHGMTMPGVNALAAAGSRLRIAYESLGDGARITYTSDDPVIVAAIHDWFNAQTTDHGADASGH